MVCDVVTKVNSIISSYRALCDQCCVSGPSIPCKQELPTNLNDLCGDGTGLLNEVYQAVQGLLTTGMTGCSGGFGESSSYPAPTGPSNQSCVTGSWLDDFKDWIDHIRCVGNTTCNSCSPPLPAKYKLTWSGLGGSFAVANGVHILSWDPHGFPPSYDCRWTLTDPLRGTLWLEWYTPTIWMATVYINGACLLRLSGGANPCVPQGTYTTINFCFDLWCSGSCAATPTPQCIVQPYNPAP